MIEKVLVANRGEIATRAFRAANELRIRSVALYAPEDRDSVHRLKADEAYEVGTPGHPVSTYLDPQVAVALARRVGADAIYPGYGFMSENPELARACAAAGIVFVGPPPEVLGLAGNKTRARDAAIAAGVPVLEASEPVADGEQAMKAAESIGFPVFVKASHGGGGRGMRLVTDPSKLAASVEEARNEAEAAFGDGTVYLEQALIRPRHIEVQLLADATGEVVHLYERDCSLQRRHQKVIEITPAPNLDPELRDRICADAVKFARHVGYVNAGTVEFLLDPASGRYAFIEMNPRIQVEHTVTEETTDIDLVRAQLRIAGGATLAELGISQEGIRQRGVALQCRVTTEDPANGFRPDAGRITAYRSPGGAGVRLDEGSAFVGAEVSPFFDPLLVKISARGRDLNSAVSRARAPSPSCACAASRPTRASCWRCSTTPTCSPAERTRPSSTSGPTSPPPAPGRTAPAACSRRLAEVTVNHEPATDALAGDPRSKLPALPQGEPPAGSRQRLLADGPRAFAQALRAQQAVAVTDTTLRDAHQSLFATRMRTHDMLAVAPHLAAELPQLLSMEVWGGATFDVALRFLHEDPWERLAQLRELVPNVCLQMLLRGQNLLAYSRFPEPVVRAFVAEAAAAGIDVFRIFDALNDVEGMRAAIEATLETHAIAEGTLCYTGDLSDPRETLYTLDYYLELAEQLVDAGVHVLAIKDMAGLLRAPAARTLVTALRESSSCRSTCTRTTPPAASSRPTWPRSRPASTRSTAPPRRWPG